MARAARRRATFATTAARRGLLRLGRNHKPSGGADHHPNRVVRGFRALGATRPVKALLRFWQPLRRDNIPRIAALSLTLLFLASGAIYMIEQAQGEGNFSSYGEALWYGIVTMTTVGYGDFTPRTGPGRAIAVVLMLGGMGLLSLFTATIASVMVARRIKSGHGLEVIQRMKSHVLVCGWNQHAGRVLDGLMANPEEQVVLVNEVPEEMLSEVVQRYPERSISYVRGDSASEAILARANVQRARAAIVLADTSVGTGMASDERTTLVTLALKSVKANIKVTAEALDMKNETHLRRAGAEDVVITGEYNGFLLSSTAIVPGISQVVSSLLSRHNGGLRREPIPSQFVGRSFGELFQELRSRHGFLTLAIVTENKGLTLDTLLADGDSLVDQFIKKQFSDAGMDFLRFEDGGVHVLVNPADSYVIGRDDTAIGIPRPA